jgi:catalase
MPLPKDERVVSLADDLLHAFDKIFGVHPGFRPAHAKGVMLTGTFAPAAGAQRLTKAPHVTRATTPVTVRFSNSTGLPSLPDTAPEANPHGLAIRFHLAEHVHTDIISHSTDGFPTRDGREFLEFLEAVARSTPEVTSPKPIEQFLGSHPAALAFVQTPKPFPSSLARETYFGVTAFGFTNADGKTKFGRYRLLPEQGSDYLPNEEISGLSTNYHFDEITERVAKGPIRFNVAVQVADASDKTDDATVHWPEDRELFELGALELTALVPDSLAQQKNIIFDPIPRVEGIAPSADPLLEVRAAIYLLSGRRRRQASGTTAA